MDAQSSGHRAVLLAEAVDGLAVQTDGRYIDGTFGRGGHSQEILNSLGTGGSLLAIDKDPEAIATGQRLATEDDRFSIVQGSFAKLQSLAEGMDSMGLVDGILVDLGVSSPQLDEAHRGFSFLNDGPLDMRMDNGSGQSAADWLAIVSEKELVTVLKTYGEERFAKRIAAAICAERVRGAITTTKQLAEITAAAHPAWEKGRHPATKTFQAIRIKVNSELQDLELFLPQALEVLRPGGRLVVISFHSLEDRIVKRFIRDQHRGKQMPANLPIREMDLERRMKPIGKAIRASEKEVTGNPRSRSAVMRVAEKIQ